MIKFGYRSGENGKLKNWATPINGGLSVEDYSVLMTIYKKDNPEYAKASIDSMLAQTHKTNDFVLVCDGDVTEELNVVIDGYVSKYPDIFNVVRLPQNVGLGAALRCGVPFCKNELIARMDDDDIANPNRCETEIKYFEEHPNCVLVGAHMNEFDNDPNEVLRVKKVPIGLDNIKKYSRRRNPFNHSTVMFKKSAVLEAGNYSEMRTNQDVELWVRMINKGYQCENIDEILVDFRFDKNTLKRRKEWKNSKLMIDVWKQFRKNKYCSYWDYLVVKWTQIAIYIMPKKLLNWVYNNLR